MLSIAEHNDLAGSLASTDRRTAQARIASLWPGGLLALAFAIAVAIPLFWPVALGPLVGFALIMLCFVSGGFTAMLVERRFDGVARQVVADTNRMAIRIMLPCLLLIGAAGRLDIVSNGVSGWVLSWMLVWIYFLLRQIALMLRGAFAPLASAD